MPMVNADIAAVFDEVADLLEVQGANPFRIRAYRNAARTLGELGRSVAEMSGEELDAIPGIGVDLAGKVAEIVATGSCAQLRSLRQAVPTGITELLHLPGLGPKRVQALHRALGVHTLDDLRQAAEQGRIQTVRGFSTTSEQHLLDTVRARLSQARRFKLPLAQQMAQALLSELKGVPGVAEAVAAGSLRRQRETVGDLDLLVTAARGAPVMERFVTGPRVSTVLSHGPTRAGVVIDGGMQVDLRLVPPPSFGAALMYFTGSKAHNIALRRMAQDRGLKLNEYGLFEGSRRIAGSSEAEVYQALGLPWIAPELREDRGEIDAAREGRLPPLVDRDALRGDLHVHTTDSDGRESLEAMAAGARAQGLQYIAITDHSQRLTAAHGLDTDRLLQQIDRIDALNARQPGLTVLKGVEVDILEDGALDLPHSVLRRLDLVVGAVHDRFDLPRDKQTERLLRAMDHRCFSILAHPTCRLIDERPACDIDLQRVVRHARERGCFLELNGNPARLDLDDLGCRMARDEGVLVSIASDAHAVHEFEHLAYGCGQARRGWLGPAQVLNTSELGELMALLAPTMGRGSRGAAKATAPSTPSTPSAAPAEPASPERNSHALH